jgi:pilus assembly protein CpaB
VAATDPPIGVGPGWVGLVRGARAARPGIVSRRRRAALLLGLALVLGALAASDVGRREAALRAQVGPAVDVLVARRPLEAGRRVQSGDLAVRRVPERFAPAGAAAVPELMLGQKLAVPVPAGAAVGEHLLLATPSGAGIRRGERAVQVVAAGSPALVVSGARVDVLVTRERGPGGVGTTELPLEDVEVLAARAARGETGPQVAATLRVTVRQAVYLAAAGAFAREIRLLPRAAGDHRTTGPQAVDDRLALVPP